MPAIHDFLVLQLVTPATGLRQTWKTLYEAIPGQSAEPPKAGVFWDGGRGLCSGSLAIRVNEETLSFAAIANKKFAVA
ncbi:hypothetical protein CDAR_286381 [Caerostris darwini]|uniref:Uncharacterized protein n=1 Tax=Caerostris darwini TaxID=1538125 RepID=A0AAV4W421_9ARAC|nr:hypothetical protein CDAR_286381 [Caerostris darwini]